MNTTISKKKQKSIKAIFLCFRPMETEIKDSSDVLDLKSITVNDKDKSKVCSSDKESIDRDQNKTARRVLYKIVKAMSFESSLNNKKVRNRKVSQDPLRTDNSLPEKIAKISDFRNPKSIRKEDEWKIDSTISNSSLSSSILNSSSSSSLSSSSSSSIASSWVSSESNGSFRSLSGRQKSFRSDSFEEKKQQQQQQKQINIGKSIKKNKKISGIILLLISLCVLILWGKVFAILCTSTWFYFVSTTRRDIEEDDEDGEPTSMRMMINSPEIQSKEEKKKIILEGFLERNHRGCFNLHQQP